MKKIGMLTLPLWNNYGGILQAYAMNSTLKKIGCDTLLIDYHKNPQTKIDKLLIIIKNLIKRRFFYNKNMNISQSDEFRNYISIKTRAFVESEILPISEKICTRAQLIELDKELDGVIVGSDQVWRPDYAPNWGHYFLDFVSNNKVRISYAASFGKDNVVFNDKQLEISRKELCLYSAISVRERSGVDIVNNSFGFKSDLVLDPTLLIDKSEYQSLIDKYNENESEGDLFTYILDHNDISNIIVNRVSEQLNLKSFEVNSRIPKSNMNKNTIDDYIYPSVTKWLRAFSDAKYVIADSFHGCVFSIIFNKPFIAVGNDERGLTRFISLLETFSLESRLVLKADDVSDELINYEFDWEKINEVRQELIEHSKKFLTNSIGVNQ